jgi:hypothetical protein
MQWRGVGAPQPNAGRAGDAFQARLTPGVRQWRNRQKGFRFSQGCYRLEHVYLD